MFVREYDFKSEIILINDALAVLGLELEVGHEVYDNGYGYDDSEVESHPTARIKFVCPAEDKQFTVEIPADGKFRSEDLYDFIRHFSPIIRLKDLPANHSVHQIIDENERLQAELHRLKNQVKNLLKTVEV